jgi:hypothetical protein
MAAIRDAHAVASLRESFRLARAAVKRQVAKVAAASWLRPFQMMTSESISRIGPLSAASWRVVAVGVEDEPRRATSISRESQHC